MLNSRLQTFYENIICEDFILLYNLTNITLLPDFEKGILSSTSNNFGSLKSSVLQSFCAWQLSTGKKSITTRAHKSIAFFNIRKETLLGLEVTLRKKALFSFLDKTLIFVLPILLTNNPNYKENQKNTLPKRLLKERVDFTLLSSIQNKSNGLILPLPAFLRTRKLDKIVDNNDILKQSNGSQKKESIAFRFKLSKNWDKQKNKNFSIIFSDNISLSAVSALRTKENKKRKYFFLLYHFNANHQGLPNGLPTTNKKNKSFFTISNRSALSFPEISSMSLFFDLLSGFSLTVSLKNTKLLHNYSITRKDLIKNQLLSALGFPKS